MSSFYDLKNLFQNNLRELHSIDASVNHLRGPLENENNERNCIFNMPIIRLYVPQEDAVYSVSASCFNHVWLQLYNLFSLSG